MGVFAERGPAVSYKIRHLTNLGRCKGIDQLSRLGSNKSYLFKPQLFSGMNTQIKPNNRIRK